MRPLPRQRSRPEDIAPLAEYLTPCVRWGYVFFALARRAQELGRWDIAERFRGDGEYIFVTLDYFSEQETTT